MVDSIDALLKQRRVVITSGTGGVGKTTVSAALGLHAATQGRSVLVITIDPAKRLKTSLGVSHIGNDPIELTDKIKSDAPVKGRFYAVVPDTRETFRQMVEELSPSQDKANAMIENPIFQIIAKEFSGANEYMALQKLGSVIDDPRFDLIILDTPPSRNTIAFLNAPRVLGRFFDEKIFQLMIRPTQNLLSKGLKVALDLLSKLTGQHFMTHLMSFLVSLFELQDRFTEKLSKMNALLSSSELGFILVTAPSPSTIPDINDFTKLLDQRDYHFDGIILNRTLGFIQDSEFEPKTEGEKKGFAIIKSYLSREKKITDKINSELKNENRHFVKLPELSRDVHSLGELAYVAHFFNP